MNKNTLLRLTSCSLLTTAVCALLAVPSSADPCGMVPPLYIDGEVPLERIGLQKTFVFFKDGVETFVIRPGFQGSVEEFGMLIPFPSPPALRKIADDTFAHVAAAVDPPEIVVDLSPVEEDGAEFVTDMPMADMSTEEVPLGIGQVAVLKQEAVGMYEVAVLEAGSAAALSQWMEDHGYRYPDGMDDVCNDYVEDGWCFVAVKARVGQKDGVDPRPGMKNADPSLPPDAVFDGHVQGMGFRFRSEELVVPMRLSAFNEGDLHNVVYLLTENPMKARDLPAGHVVRQIDGQTLFRNVTEPLPLRIIGGTYDDIPDYRKESLKGERDPAPHNGIAKDLFAGDLVAASTGQLSHDHEELEKSLLNIGERLGLRGPEIDSLHADVIREQKNLLTASAIEQLKSMTLTVIDGDFEREVVAADNIYFTRFEINPALNTARKYNARLFGPSSEGLDFGAATGVAAAAPSSVAVSHPEHGRLILQDADATSARNKWLIGAGVLVTAAFFCVLLMRRRKGASAGLILFCLVAGQSFAQEASDDLVNRVNAVLDEIEESADRSAAISGVRALGESSVDVLLDVVRSSESIERRGWAIICLREIGGARVANGLDELIADSAMPGLVQTWAAAARLESASHFEDLDRFARLSGQLPAIRRPLRLRILALTATKDSPLNVEKLLRLGSADHELQQALAPVLLNMKPEELTNVLLTSDDVPVRQQAAAWLATQKSRNVKGVNAAVVQAISFKKGSDSPPWSDGPLFIPGVNWNKDEATLLVNELTAWYVWCSVNERPEEINKIRTNLNSWQLMNAAGFRQVPGTVSEWLSVWENIIGSEKMQDLMSRTGYKYSPAKIEPAE